MDGLEMMPAERALVSWAVWGSSLRNRPPETRVQRGKGRVKELLKIGLPHKKEDMARFCDARALCRTAKGIDRIGKIGKGIFTGTSGAMAARSSSSVCS